LHPKLKV